MLVEFRPLRHEWTDMQKKKRGENNTAQVPQSIAAPHCCHNNSEATRWAALLRTKRVTITSTRATTVKWWWAPIPTNHSKKCLNALRFVARYGIDTAIPARLRRVSTKCTRQVSWTTSLRKSAVFASSDCLPLPCKPASGKHGVSSLETDGGDVQVVAIWFGGGDAKCRRFTASRGLIAGGSAGGAASSTAVKLRSAQCGTG